MRAANGWNLSDSWDQRVSLISRTSYVGLRPISIQVAAFRSDYGGQAASALGGPSAAFHPSPFPTRDSLPLPAIGYSRRVSQILLPPDADLDTVRPQLWKNLRD
jgi:hypothetical protein